MIALAASSWPVATLFEAYRRSNLFSGKLIVLILLFASILAWSVMITKFWELRRAKWASRRFLRAFREQNHPLALYGRGREFAESPIYNVYEAGCLALGTELDLERGPGRESWTGGRLITDARLNTLQIEVVRRATERSVADQALALESKMGWLATAVSASPLLGLLGTVWGVLDAFAAMAETGAANLSAVAPGISSALLTTVVGLLVALPSAIGYNILASTIRELAVQMDNFAQEFVAELQRHFVRE